MNRFAIAPFVISLAWLISDLGFASAQFTYPYRPPQYGPGYAPQLSPYLNMLRPGDPAINYFSGVMPELQRRQDRTNMYGSLQGLMMQLPAPPNLSEQDFDVPMVSTGHPTAFNYTGMYFNNSMIGQGTAIPYSQRRGGMMSQQRPGQMGGSGGTWPNMMPRMGMGGMYGR
jgi:hypothetical protein